MARGSGLRVTGLNELLTTLRQTAPREAKNLARTVVHAVAAEMGKEIRKNAPAGKSKQLKKQIKWFRNNPRYGRFSSRVVANARNPKDKTKSKYWKFQEFGKRDKPASRPFVLPVKQDFANRMPQIMREQFMKKLQQRLARQARRNTR